MNSLELVKTTITKLDSTFANKLIEYEGYFIYEEKKMQIRIDGYNQYSPVEGVDDSKAYYLWLDKPKPYIPVLHPLEIMTISFNRRTSLDAVIARLGIPEGYQWLYRRLENEWNRHFNACSHNNDLWRSKMKVMKRLFDTKHIVCFKTAKILYEAEKCMLADKYDYNAVFQRRGALSPKELLKCVENTAWSHYIYLTGGLVSDKIGV
jgi:hypothetical protein